MQFEFLYTSSLFMSMGLCILMLLLIIQIAYRFGRNNKASESVESLMEMIPASLLGLIALLMGFTFSMALSRFDARKVAMVNETNAIETAWLRAGLLAKDETVAARKALIAYLDHRIQFPKAAADPADRAPYQQKNEILQTAIWKIAESESNRDRTPTTALFTNAVNQMIDLSTVRMFASQDHVPQVAYLVIFAITMACLYLLASIYAFRRLRRGPLFLLAILLCLVLGLIEDLDRPSHGLIQIDIQMMLDLKSSLEKR
jgi:hypothetical protein